MNAKSRCWDKTSAFLFATILDQIAENKKGRLANRPF